MHRLTVPPHLIGILWLDGRFGPWQRSGVICMAIRVSLSVEADCSRLEAHRGHNVNQRKRGVSAAVLIVRHIHTNDPRI